MLKAHNGGPDIKWAWKNFNGKTLEEACEMMASEPDVYSEDFMWMGGPAFKFYFPAFDRYLRSLPVAMEFANTSGCYIGACIQTHFDRHQDMSGVHDQIISLCDYVCAHPTHFDEDLEEQQEITARWADLRQQVLDDSHGIRRPR